MRLNATSVNGKWSPADSETRLEDLTTTTTTTMRKRANGFGHADADGVDGLWPSMPMVRDETEEHGEEHSEHDRLCAQLDRAQHDGQECPDAAKCAAAAAAACRAGTDKEKEPQLLSFADAPHYLQFNPFIHSGYRSGMMTTKMCLESAFWWTNETINIWSHIFGWMLFFGLTLYDLLLLNIHASYTDKFIVGSLLVCFQVCMLLSSLYHTFSCRSEADYDCFLTLDLLGIALSLLAIYMSGIYYAFWCHKALRSFYLITVAFIFGLAMVIQIPRLKLSSNVKMATFVGWAAYGVVPTLHWTIVMGGWANPMVQKLLPRVLGMYGITGLAFLIYITKFPERYISGRVDYIGASHQWWHVFVVIALYYWHNTGIQYVEYRMNHGCMVQS